MSNTPKLIEKSIEINTSPQKVWETVTCPDQFKIWNASFCENSYFEGHYKLNEVITYLAPTDRGLMGMKVKVTKFEPYSLIETKCEGTIVGGVLHTSGPEHEEWDGTKERFIFEELEQGCRFSISNEVPESDFTFFDESWEACFKVIKRLCEES